MNEEVDYDQLFEELDQCEEVWSFFVCLCLHVYGIEFMFQTYIL